MRSKDSHNYADREIIWSMTSNTLSHEFNAGNIYGISVSIGKYDHNTKKWLRIYSESDSRSANQEIPHLCITLNYTIQLIES